MHKLTVTLSALAIVATSATLVIADNLNNEVVPMLYLSKPIGGGTAEQRQPGFGAALGTVDMSAEAAERGEAGNLAPAGRPRLLDLRFKQGGIDALQMNGVSLLQKIVTRNADGTTEEELASADLTPGQYTMIVLGVGAMLCVSDVICSDNNNNAESAPPADDIILEDAVADAVAE